MADEQSPMEFDEEKVPEVLPILPLYDAALFPKMVLPLVVLQGESVQLVDEAMAKDRIIGLMVSKKPDDKATPDREDLAEVGTSALILKMAKTQDNRTQLLVQGLSRFRIKNFEDGKPYLVARIELLKDVEKKDNETEALMSNILGQFERVVELSPGLPPEIAQMAKTIQEAGNKGCETATERSHPPVKPPIGHP
jgi:ATP-dependent Lon protease